MVAKSTSALLQTPVTEAATALQALENIVNVSKAIYLRSIKKIVKKNEEKILEEARNRCKTLLEKDDVVDVGGIVNETILEILGDSNLLVGLNVFDTIDSFIDKVYDRIKSKLMNELGAQAI